MGVYGKQLYGQIDHVPGLFYTATLFWHVNYVPLVPLQSYTVLEGSESESLFRGTPVPLQLKSVLAGYLRGWLAAVAVVAGFLSAAYAAGFYVSFENGRVLAVIATVGAMGVALWFIISTRTRWFLPLQFVLLLASAVVYHDVNSQYPDLAAAPIDQIISLAQRQRDIAFILGTLLTFNTAGLLFSLTRLLTPASHRRALELGASLGLTPEQVAAWISQQRKRPMERGVMELPPDEPAPDLRLPSTEIQRKG